MSKSGDLDGRTEQSAKHGSSLKEKALEEFKKYWVIAIYLFLMFGAFTLYRRLVEAEVGISYLHYGFAAVKALIFAKVILIGQALGLSRRFIGPPLIKSVLLDCLVYGLFFLLFAILEEGVVGLVHHESWRQIANSLVSEGKDEILARTVMVVVTFVPFFFFLEADKALGEGKLFALFFRRGSSV
jgi:hypothetical protein